MKAIVIDAFVSDLAALKPTNVPSPPCPSSSQAVHVKITHAAITHVDMLYAQGLHQNNRRHMKPPFILGNEFAGVVLSSSTKFKAGTRVFGGSIGSYAEQICVHEDALRKVPDSWTNAEACAVGASGAISYAALTSITNLKAGQTLLVLGASGGLGVMAVQIAKAIGARVIATAGDEEKANVLRSIGADQVVDYKSPDWEKQVKSKTDGEEGVHVVYDGIGAVESGIKCLRYRGQLVIVGFAARGGEMESLTMNRVLLKGITLHGYRFGEDGRRDPSKTKQAWDGFSKLVDQGHIRPVIYRESYDGLEELPRALDDLEKHKVWGRAVLRVNEDAEAESFHHRL
ncbi:NAD(P)-binding protein [Corynespora cassiicola Philippines]|uniref:NAD(P)-binding protein n=1 Tax=Corynespora cassiicola Philippines TaxID=1448308 RepID=A0A2T2NXI0_CORCC|nr:NAD(P)-binding protein [Corynespora cassiicola Philippines]